MIRADVICPVPELLRRAADAHSDRVAFGDATREVTYSDLWERTGNLAGHLQNEGVRHGDTVVLLMSNSVALVESYLAVTRAGAVGVCLSPQVTSEDIHFFLKDVSPSAVITADAQREAVSTALHRQKRSATVIVADDPGTPDAQAFDELTRTRSPVAPADDLGMKEPAWILYTSGTTGRPKGVVLNQHGMLWVVGAGWLPFLDLGPDDYVLCPLPLFHSYPLDMLLAVLAVGGREHIMERFSTAEALRLLHEKPITVLLGVPTTFSYLVDGLQDGPAPRDRLRMSVTAGAVMSPALWERAESALKAPMIDAYGATETSTAITLSSPRGTRIPGSCGVPIPGFSVRIIDPTTGKDVGSGEEGELIVRGPGVMLGYHNRPQETRETLRDGWYHSGDLARIDDIGFVTITGRVKDTIIRGGENIAPTEIEEVVLRHYSVADCAVVRKEHEQLGEAPVLFVVSSTGTEIDYGQILAWCRDQLAPPKVPAEVHVVDEIPKTASGKIMRHKLEASLSAS